MCHMQKRGGKGKKMTFFLKNLLFPPEGPSRKGKKRGRLAPQKDP